MKITPNSGPGLLRGCRIDKVCPKAGALGIRRDEPKSLLLSSCAVYQYKCAPLSWQSVLTLLRKMCPPSAVNTVKIATKQYAYQVSIKARVNQQCSVDGNSSN